MKHETNVENGGIENKIEDIVLKNKMMSQYTGVVSRNIVNHQHQHLQNNNNKNKINILEW